MITEKDLDIIEERFKDIFATKDDLSKLRSELLDKLDQILGEIIKSREEQTIVEKSSSN